MPFRASHRSFARSCVAEVWTFMLLRVDRTSSRRGSVKMGPLEI